MSTASLQQQITELHLELKRTNSDLMQLTIELEDRVAERTAELLKVNEALQLENAARKKIERRLREQAKLIEKANDAIITTDLSHRVQFWNPAALRLLGWTAAEFEGRPLSELLGIERLGGSEETTLVFSTLVDWNGAICGHTRSGAELILETSVTILRDDTGRATGRLIISSDITERKKLEEKFLRAQRMESIGMLSAGIAHDLNNVLAPIGMAATILRPRLSRPEDFRLLNTLDKCVMRGTGLVRQILGFAHGVSGHTSIVQVKHLMRDIIDVITATFPKSIVLKHYVHGDIFPIQGNPTQIHQILLNLCVNARDAMPAGGTLTLNAENCTIDAAIAEKIPGAQPGNWLVIYVQDSGSGIQPEVLARIWEPFFTTKSTTGGTGLGLSTVRTIVESHHGFITVETKVDHGTGFRVYLPALSSDFDESVLPATSSAQRGQGEKVLVVDDEEDVREAFRAVLTNAGYDVVTANDGAEAAALIVMRGDEFDLIIADYEMPTLDGRGLARVIRARQPKKKILVVSGANHPLEHEIANRKELADAFLAKPFSADSLLATVEKLLSRLPH